MAILKRRGLSLIIPPEQLTASAERVTGRNSQQLRRLIQPWQQQALMYYQTVGEAWYGAQFYSRALSKLRVYAARRDENGEIQELDASDPVSQLLARIQDRNGGTSQLFGSYGRLMFLIGEGYLTVTTDVQDDIEEWEFLSSDELRVQPGTNASGPRYLRYKAPGIEPVEFDSAPDDQFVPMQVEKDGKVLKKVVVYRLWRRHPQYSGWADSPMHGVLNLFEELSLLQLAVGARAKSRAAGPGILYVPQELTFGNASGVRNDDPLQDPVMRMITDIFQASIKNPGNAGAVAPIVLRGPAQIGGVSAKDALFMIQIHDPLQTYPEQGLREECIKRIATGLDMPPELLLGMTDANHWTAWQIDDATWTAHLQPVAEQLVSDLNSAYLRPAAKAENIQGWQDIVIGYDAAEIINHPDRVADAKDLQDRGAIGNAKLREVAGFSDEDAPSEEEHDEWLAIKLRDRTFIVDQGGTVAINKADNQTQPMDQPAAVGKEGPPDEQDLQNEDANLSLGASANGSDLLVSQILAAADMSVERIRELAGSRIRSKAAKCEECRPFIDPVTNSLVASALGAERTQAVTGGLDLVGGGTAGFCSALGRWGVSVESTNRLAQLIEQHAAKSLFKEQADPLPRGFRDYVARVI